MANQTKKKSTRISVLGSIFLAFLLATSTILSATAKENALPTSEFSIQAASEEGVIEEPLEEAEEEEVPEEVGSEEADVEEESGELLTEEGLLSEAAEPFAEEEPAPVALYTGTHGTCTWTYDDATRELILEPTNGISGELTNLGGFAPWTLYQGMMQKVTIMPGVSGVGDMSCMFSGSLSLTSLDLSNFDTSRVTNMSAMFKECENLTSIKLSNFNTAQVTDMSFMFNNCFKLESLDLSHFNTQQVTNMGSMFNGCNSLTGLSVANFYTTGVTNMSHMFSGCNSLASLDLSSFNTMNINNMSAMFNGCYALTNLDVSHFNTSKVTDMSAMFSSCESLTTLDLLKFDTSQVKNMAAMFGSCKSLTNPQVASFNTSQVTDMAGMFQGCASLATLDLSNFNTSQVKDMNFMFWGCYTLTSLDLSNFENSATTNLPFMFKNCTDLDTIILGPNFTFVGRDNGSLLPNPDPDSMDVAAHSAPCYWESLDTAGERTGETYSIDGYGGKYPLADLNANVSVPTTYVHVCLFDIIDVTVPTELLFSVNVNGEVKPVSASPYLIQNNGNVDVEVTDAKGKLDSALPATKWQCLVPSEANAVLWQGNLSAAGANELPLLTTPPVVDEGDSLELVWQPVPGLDSNTATFKNIFLSIKDSTTPTHYASVCYVIGKA